MIVAYLTFNGKTEEAFNFYRSAIGGEITNIQRFGDNPQGGPVPESEKQKIMHIALKTPHGVIMGNDHAEFWGEPYKVGNNLSMSIHPDSEAEATRLFNGLSQGGNIIVPMAKAPWGAYFGMFFDKFGLKWMINYQPV